MQKKSFNKLDIKHHSFGDGTFKRIFEKSRTGEIDCVIPVESNSMNERYYLQQSVFLSPTNPYKKFEEQLDFLNGILDQSLIQILIPRTERNKVIRDLEKMNISHASLFPGIDGFAKSLKIKFSTLSTISELGENLNKLKREGLING